MDEQTYYVILRSDDDFRREEKVKATSYGHAEEIARETCNLLDDETIIAIVLDYEA
jgi:hypothetical protein